MVSLDCDRRYTKAMCTIYPNINHKDAHTRGSSFVIITATCSISVKLPSWSIFFSTFIHCDLLTQDCHCHLCSVVSSPVLLIIPPFTPEKNFEASNSW